MRKLLNQNKMEIGNQNAYPVTIEDNGNPSITHLGLTKREYFAAMAMQGLLSNPEFIKGGSFDFKSRGTEEKLSSISTQLADELLKKLDKSKSE